MRVSTIVMLVVAALGFGLLSTQETLAQASREPLGKALIRAAQEAEVQKSEKSSNEDVDTFVDQDRNGWNDKRERSVGVGGSKGNKSARDSTHDYFIDKDRDGFSDRRKGEREILTPQKDDAQPNTEIRNQSKGRSKESKP